MSPVLDGWRDNSGIDSGPDVAASETTGDETVCGAMARGNEAMRARSLLIEDDKETADEIRAELGEHGFEVDWAANGIEGLRASKLWKARDPSCIALGSRPGGLDGCALGCAATGPTRPD